MKENIKAIMSEMRNLKERQRQLSDELVNEVMKYPGVEEALKDGLIRLNFQAPTGFMAFLRKHQ